MSSPIIVSSGTTPIIRPTGGGAPINAQYLVLAADDTLTVERVFTAGAGIGVVDGGAGSAFTVRVLFGTSASTACVGDDSRLSDSRAPTGAAGGDLAGTYPAPTIQASAIVTRINAMVGTADYFDTKLRIVDATDVTAKVAFSALSVSSGFTRTLTVQDASYTIAGIDYANTFTGTQTFDVIKSNHLDAVGSAGIHVGNATHQDVAIFGAGGGQGTTFYGQINGTSLVLSGTSATSIQTAGGVTAAGVVSGMSASGPGIIAIGVASTQGWVGLGSSTHGLQGGPDYTGVNIRVNNATLMALSDDGSVKIGTDPGGAEKLRVGGGITIASANYIYLRGDASTDGSVRFSSQSAGTMLIEKRASGSWVSIGSFA